MFYKTFHPEIFQGHLKKKNYFEGWYFKYVSKSLSHTFAFIPGISLNKKDTHAFIQVFISDRTKEKETLKTYYFKYDINAFSFHPKTFKIQIAENMFSSDSMFLSIDNDDLDLQVHLENLHLTPIKKNLLFPSIMGPFGYLGFMETYHGIVSMSHQVKGSILLNKEAISFNQGKGYVEKDWGTSFPSSYTWMQSNHFKDSKTSFMLSYATIPFLFFKFKGLISVLIVQGKEFRFATYNLSSVKQLDYDENSVSITIKKRSLKLVVTATTSDYKDLPSPRLGQMNETIKEGLSGNITLKLYKKNTLIYEDEGVASGIEIMLEPR